MESPSINIHLRFDPTELIKQLNKHSDALHARASARVNKVKREKFVQGLQGVSQDQRILSSTPGANSGDHEGRFEVGKKRGS